MSTETTTETDATTESAVTTGETVATDETNVPSEASAVVGEGESAAVPSISVETDTDAEKSVE